MTPRRILVATGFFVAITAGAVGLTSDSAPVAQPAFSTRAAPARLVGSNSCAAAACHGGDTIPGREYLTVLESDPHRHAFSVLFQERSVRMVRLLAGGHEHAPAHQTDLCLRCHGAAPPNLGEPLRLTDELHRSATCENCHGAAGNWLTTHYTRPWKALTLPEKASHGFLPTKDLAFRSQLCAGCHVGEPGREVDHRLIAAGHPALRFELSAFLCEPLYTRHWQEMTYGPDVEAWLWAIGQVGTARASAELLRHRASDANRDWPELAEYTCFACHQDLGVSIPGRGPRTDGPRPGQLPWGSWPYPLVAKMADGSLGEWCQPAQGSAGLTGLAAMFQKTDRPDRMATAKQASAAVADLDRWLGDLQARAARRASAGPLPSAMRELVRFGGDVPRTGSASTDWDRSAQAYLATAALYRAQCALDPAARDERMESELRGLAAGLQFPARQDSPRPGAGSRDEVWKRWAALAARLDPGGRP